MNFVKILFKFTEKRKEPPEADTKPSSSVEGPSKGSAKRPRR